MMRRLFSWIMGIRIGERKLLLDTPFVIGGVEHFLPPDMWTDDLFKSLLCNFVVIEWDGYNWAVVDRVQKPLEEGMPNWREWKRELIQKWSK